jgi:hypothetical protein
MRGHVLSDTFPGVPTLRERLERGYGMRAQRLVEAGLLGGAILADDLRLAAVAFVLLLAQAVLSPFASPVALLWAACERRLPDDALGNLYYDFSGSRGAAAISCTVLALAWGLVQAGLPTAGKIALALPTASCVLSATVGFCAGCTWYVLGRDGLKKLRLWRGPPLGASDVEIHGHQ